MATPAQAATAPATDAVEGANASLANDRHPDAVEVFHCDFEEPYDVNYDRWPDGWTRRRGIDYPVFLPIELVDVPAARPDHPNPPGTGERCLQMKLDGGAATVYSAPIPVSPLFSYVIEATLLLAGDPQKPGDPRERGLEHNVAFMTISFYDAEHKQLETYSSEQLRQAADWTKVRIGPLTPNHQDVRLAVIGLHLHPTDKADLRGTAMFNDVWVGRLPRMTLHSNSEHNVYSDPKDVEITCNVSGIKERDPLMEFELVGVSSEHLAGMKNRLEGEVVALKQSRASDLFGVKDADGNKQQPNVDGYAGEMTWRPPIENYGFYRVQVKMIGGSGVMHERTISLAVIRPAENPIAGEFGWSLPQGDDPLPLAALASLLPQVGINWVKFPVWYSDNETGRADRLAWFAERLSAQGIEIIGMLDQPPRDVRAKFGEGDRLLAANIFAEPELWQPVLIPVMTRLSLKVRWWQLGRDDDISFVGYPDLAQKIGEVKEQLSRFGQKIHLGIGWRWVNAAPRADNPPWAFLSNTADPALTQEELATYLSAPKQPGVKRWVVLEPIDDRRYSVEDRARDLVGRMLAAKMQHADAVFVPDPFNPHHGLMNPDGTPAEMLLPWRTTALMMSGTEYVGAITMPGGSHNYIFAKGDSAIMVAWNEQPTTETIYLGEKVEQFDLWGRTIQPAMEGHRQRFEIGPLPTFISGVNLPITRWRMSVAFDNHQLESVFNRPQRVTCRMTNHFERGAGGTISVIMPEIWGKSPLPSRFKLAGGEEFANEFQITLRSDANSGEQPVRIDFDITADRNYKFSVWRTMEIGKGDITIEPIAHLNERGELIVEQHLSNDSDAFVSFNCMLYAPTRRRQRQQVLNLSRGRDTKTFVLSDGKELIGKTLWLRAEEIGGSRILNYRFVVEE